VFGPSVSVQQEGRVLRVHGELELASGQELVDTLRRALRDAPPGTLVVDLGDVQFVDSAGLAALIRCRRLAGRYGRDVIIACNDASPCGRMLELTQLANVFTVAPDVPAALDDGMD